MLYNEGKAPNGTRIVSAQIIHEMMKSRVPIPDPYMFGPEWTLGLIVCDWHGEIVAIYDFKNGVAQYLHTNCRVNPRVSN